LQSEPYQAPVAGQDERVRPFGLWPRLTWFVIGSVASWTASSVIGFHQGQSRDYTRSLPPSLREIAPEWLTDALAVTAGSLVMITSADSTNASALIHPVHHGSFPGASGSSDQTCGLSPQPWLDRRPSAGSGCRSAGEDDDRGETDVRPNR
jgi:hypothetical protein